MGKPERGRPKLLPGQKAMQDGDKNFSAASPGLERNKQKSGGEDPAALILHYFQAYQLRLMLMYPRRPRMSYCDWRGTLPQPVARPPPEADVMFG